MSAPYEVTVADLQELRSQAWSVVSEYADALQGVVVRLNGEPVEHRDTAYVRDQLDRIDAITAEIVRRLEEDPAA